MIKTVLFILFAFIASQESFSQLSTRNDWDIEGLKNNPSDIKITVSVFEEKFGEMTEEPILTVDVSFNPYGNYLKWRQKMLPGKKLTKVIIEKPEMRSLFILKGYQATYHYPFKYGYTVFLDFESGIRPASTSESSNTITEREYDEWNMCKKIKSDDFTSNIHASWEYLYENGILKEIKEYEAWGLNSISKFEYKNDNHNILVRSFTGNGSVIEIMEYIYTGSLLSEIKYYNKDGILDYNSRFKYDSKGNLVQTDDYISKVLDRNIYYTYNEKNDITKETQVRAKTYPPESAETQMKDYYWYKYEYYPGGLLKKTTKIHHGLKNQDGVNYPNDYTFEMREYKYDDAGNWIEEIIWEDNYKYNKLMQKYRITREIVYF